VISSEPTSPAEEVQSTPDRLGEVIIVGGGCYGTFYARQLDQARAKGKATYRSVVVVDRDPACRVMGELGEAPDRRLVVSDWDPFFDQYLSGTAEAGEDDVIVPSPFMPHLMFQWLVRRARVRWPGRRVEIRALDQGPGTPYDRSAPDGTRYVSFADWLCPTHCIEPSLCPVIRAPRTWEMSEAIIDLRSRLNLGRSTAGPVLFVVRHLVFAVGTFSTRSVLAGDAEVAAAGAAGTPVDVLVGTLSACHGAVNLLYLGPL
jgi:hypothetical protein